MGIKYFSRGIASASLVLAFVTSMVFVSARFIIEDQRAFQKFGPSSIEPGPPPLPSLIEVIPGGVFVLRAEILFWEAEVPGYYGFTIVWEDNNRADENFTVICARAFFDNDNDNLPGASPIWLENTTILVGGAGTNGTRWTFTVYNTTGDPNDGYFDVEIYMQAGSRGTPHRAPWDHAINKLGWGGSIDWGESTSESIPLANPFYPNGQTVRVLARGVKVSISPDNQENLPGGNLSYTVTVKNTGNMGSDNYDLTASDNAGWGDNVWLDNYRLENIPQGENRTTTLRVHIPENAAPCTEDNITVTATSQADNTVKDNASCIANVNVRGVDVLISPQIQSGLPPVTLTFTVTVTNTGTAWDNYNLSIDNTQPWTHTLDNTKLYIPASENRTTTLRVSIPGPTPFCTMDYVTVTATSIDPTIKDNATCRAHAVQSFFVDIEVLSPKWQENFPGTTVVFNIMAQNIGSWWDNLLLSASDDAGWPLVLSDNRFDNVPSGEYRYTTLTISIPGSALPSTTDDITVTETSESNPSQIDSDTCEVHVTLLMEVEVEVTPDYQNGTPGSTLDYTITVTNMGNVDDNYGLAVSDNADWGLTVSPTSLMVPAGENRTATLSVTIPENALHCTEDNILVTTTSMENAEVRDNYSCVAHAAFWTGSATFSLENLYAVRLDKDLWLYQGSKLVVKFYNYDNTYENEVVIDNFTPPWHVEENENVAYPGENIGIKKAKLLLVDNENNEISKIKGWETIRDDLWKRLMEIRSRWPYAGTLERDALWAEIMGIRSQWPYAPSTRDPVWVDC